MEGNTTGGLLDLAASAEVMFGGIVLCRIVIGGSGKKAALA